MNEWPPKKLSMGIDVPSITLKIPDTGYPPEKPYEPYLIEPIVAGPVLEPLLHEVRDEAAAHKKAWDTRGRGRKRRQGGVARAKQREKIVNNYFEFFSGKGLDMSMSEYQDVFPAQLRSELKNLANNDKAESDAKWNRIRNGTRYGDEVKEMEQTMELANEAFVAAYDAADEFYRGTSMSELISYMKSGVLGETDAGGTYNYVAVSLSDAIANVWNAGIVVEYDADAIKKLGSQPVHYTVQPQPDGVSSSIQNAEELGKPMWMGYDGEAEIRVPCGGKIKKGLIKKIRVMEVGWSDYDLKMFSRIEKKLGVEIEFDPKLDSMTMKGIDTEHLE